MEKHRGEIVEAAIRRSGYTITTVSTRLGVSRNTLYSKFKKPNLNYHFIASVGRSIHYDFANDFSEIKQLESGTKSKKTTPIHTTNETLLRLEQQYMRLLEVYNRLLHTLVGVSNDSKLAGLKEEVIQLMEESVAE